MQLDGRLSSGFRARAKTHPSLGGAGPVVQRSKARAARGFMRSDRTIGRHLRRHPDRSDQRVGFVHLLNKARPGVPDAARAFVLRFARMNGLASQGAGMPGAGGSMLLVSECDDRIDLRRPPGRQKARDQHRPSQHQRYEPERHRIRRAHAVKESAHHPRDGHGSG